MSDVNGISCEMDSTELADAESLLPLVYDELRRLAAAKLANEQPGQTLQATALVHEAYLRLVNGRTGQIWQGRRHFFCAAAEAMRRILIEAARRKKSLKRGGGNERVGLDAATMITPPTTGDLEAISEAVAKLEEISPERAELV